jgi:transposase-like protein
LAWRKKLQAFQDRLPVKPYCTDNFAEGLKILPLSLALTKKYIQVNPPGMKSFLLFDVDRIGAGLAAEDADLPPPSICVVNPANLHAHILYALIAPVCTTAAALNGPQRYCKAIEWAYRERLGADMGYAGLIVKNPWSAAWWTIENGNAVYQLSALADYVELPRKIPKRENGLGRNCTLFDTLRFWAYKAIRDYWKPGGYGSWEEALRTQASSVNDFSPALPLTEVTQIARSVARWTWRHTTPEGLQEKIEKTHTPELQKARREKRTEKQNAVKEQGIELIKQGKKISEVTEILNVSRETVSRWKPEDLKEKQDAVRKQGLKMIEEDKNITEIARLLKVSRMTVSRWKKNET